MGWWPTLPHAIRLQSPAQPAGTAGGEGQQADIKQLLKELEVKKAKLNELKVGQTASTHPTPRWLPGCQQYLLA